MGLGCVAEPMGVTFVWPDNETTVDMLGFRIHANLVEELVKDERILPVTIGLFGDWGSGKTSIMRMIQRDLDDGQKDNSPPC